MTESSLQITSKPSPEGLEIKLEGALGLKNAEASLQRLTSLVNSERAIALDLSGLTYLDGQGIAVLIELRARCAASRIGFSIASQSDVAKKMLGMVAPEKILAPLPAAREKEGFFEQVGGATIDLFEDLKEVVRFVGECSIMIWQAVKHPSKVRWRSVWTNLEKTGVDALPIVCMIQFMIGIILSVLGKSVLGMYGATAFIPDLVAIALAQELGPLITAVVLFFIMKSFNTFKDKAEKLTKKGKEEEEKPEEIPDDIRLLTEIRDALKK